MEIRTFKAGDLVWLSIPTASKLDPHWEGGWKANSCKSPVTVEVFDGTRTLVVHVIVSSWWKEMKDFRLKTHRVTGYHHKSAG